MTVPASRPTGYVGVKAPRPPNVHIDTRAPLSTDYLNFDVGDLWINRIGPFGYILVKKLAGVATWAFIGGSPGTMQSLSDNAGTKAFPDGTGNIQIAAGAGITTTTTGANTLTIALAGGGQAIDEISVDANTAPGTNPVVPTALGAISITGAQVATGTIGANVIRTNSIAANGFQVEVQRSTTAAGANSALNGVSHFDSASFAVDANGFVTLAGGGIAIDSIGVDANTAPGTNPVLATAAGQVTITGAQVATGTIGANVIRTNSIAANEYTIQIQQTTTSAAKDTSKNGVSHFNSNQFGVDEGFISLSGSNSSQPSFYAQLSASVDNVTGDSTNYTVIFDNEIFDQTNSYDPTTGVFTAPSAGIYLFTSNVLVNNVNNVAYNEAGTGLTTTQRTFFMAQINPGVVYSTAGGTFVVSLPTSVVCQMAQGDTASISVLVGGGPKTVQVRFGGATDPRTFFSGCKLF